MSEWESVTLGDLSTSIQYGYTESASSEPIGPRFLRITDIQDDFINWSDVPYCKISDKDFRKYKLEKGDICIARTGNSTGATAFIKDDIEAVFASYLIRYQLDTQRVVPDFIGFLLRGSYWQKFVQSIKGGSAQAGANAKSFASFPILLPPLPEQKKIAAVLSCLDRKIENLRKQNETLEAIAQTLFKHWFIDFEFPNADGKPYKSSGGAMEPSELGDIPAGWRVGTLGDEVETLGGSTPSTKEPDYWVDGDIDWYSPTDLTKSNTLFSLGSDKHITKLGLEKSSARLFPAYSILLTSRATIGEITINTKPACTNQGFITILPNEKFSVYFLHGWLLTQINLIKQLASGSTFPELSKSTFRKFLFLIPAPRQLENYDQAINPLFQKTENNTRQIQILTQTRDVLLPKLMSGKLRITS